MSAIYPIYIDTAARQAVTSPAVANPITLPTLMQGETPTLNLFFLTPKNDGSQTYNVIDVTSGYSCKVALCGNTATPVGQPVGNTSPTIAAAQTAFTTISSPYNGLTGPLALTDPLLDTLLGANNLVNSVTLEVELTAAADMLPVKVLDAPVTVKASVIRGISITSTPSVTTGAIFNSVTQKFEFYINGNLVASIP